MFFSFRVIVFDVGIEEMLLEILVFNFSLFEVKNIKIYEIYLFLIITVYFNDFCKVKKNLIKIFLFFR